MAGRWGDPSAFRADPDAAPAAHPSRRQAIALLAVLALVAGAVVVVSYLIRPERARAFDLFYGSMFLSYQNGPVAVDLTSGKPTLQLVDAEKQVGLSDPADLGVVPLIDHTLLLNTSTGEFNMVDNSGFVVKHDGGVPLVKRPSGASAVGIAADNGQAYIERTGPTGGTDVYLVSQPTVETAVTATGNVRPRASGSMPEPGTTDPGGAASANGDLWLLVGGAGDGGSRTIRQLHVPSGSSAGATLARIDHGQVNGAAAIGTVTPSGASGSAQTVAVASDSRIDVFTPGASKPRRVSFPAPPGLDTVLPVSNAQGRIAFLMHGAQGWYLVSVNPDGTDLRPPALLDRVPGNAHLAAPASSNGRMYTIDQSNGQLYEITYDGTARRLPGRSVYPFDPAEGSDFRDGYVLSRGPRVIFNSPTHQDALIVFTDGSRAPRTIVKTSAVAVNAANAAEALTRSTVPQVGKPSVGKPKPVPGGAQPINSKIDCKTAKQKPHLPVITSAVPGSRTVTLAWTYPILSPQDCYPSTYLVSVKRISNDAPDPPGSVRVDSQTGATIGGLFPSTQYDVTVSAFIHEQGTASEPVRITTGVEGPAAPTNLKVGADSSGNWQLNWDSCGTVQQGCVAAQSWTVNASYCDGRSVGSPPPSISVTADPTSKHQPPAVYKGNDDLLGRGLRFSVLGVGDQGQAGAPSAASQCVYSWMPPNASAMSLQASTAPVRHLGEPTTATVSLNLGSDPVRAEGGVGATFTYQLLAGGKVASTIGPTTKTTVHFAGVRAGVSYQAQAIVAAPRHPSATATVGPIDVETAHAPWPTITVTTDPATDDGDLKATVTVHIGGLSSADANGERFDLTPDSGVYCGNAAETDGWDRTTAIDPADPRTFTVDRTRLYGDGCTVHVQLVQADAFGTAVFGAGTSSNNATSAPFHIDPPALTGVESKDFSASWDGVDTDGRSHVAVSYNGGNLLIGLFARNWTVSVTDPDGDTCGGYQDRDSLDDVSIRQACVDADGKSGQGWDVAITFTYLGSPQPTYHVIDITGGRAPTYSPPQCDVARAGLSATWGGAMATPIVNIDVNDASAIKDCSGWSYTAVGPTTANCGTGTGAPPTQFDVVCSDPPATTGWSVTVAYTDANGTVQSYEIKSIDGPLPP
jgi:hypothetical protein